MLVLCCTEKNRKVKFLLYVIKSVYWRVNGEFACFHSHTFDDVFRRDTLETTHRLFCMHACVNF